MKVILLKTIKGLGNTDAVKEVKEGYARNYLFPHNLAIQATPAEVKEIEDRKKKNVKASVENLRLQQSLVGQLDGIEVEISEKANSNGGLYAAVTPQKISNTLGAMGYQVKSEQIITKPLKQVGTFPVVVRFGDGLEAEISVIINSLT